MEKKIRRLILSVLFCVIIVLISVPLWSYSSGRKGALIASSYSDLSITVNVGTFPSLVVIEENRAFDNIKTTELSLRNPNKTTKKFGVYFLYDKKSTIDYKDIVVSLDSNIYYIKDLEMIEDNDNYYFKILDMSLGSYSDRVYKARIWLSDDITNLSEDMNLIANFIAR